MPQENKLTILLIEADTALRRLIVLGLQHRGIDVIEASSPATIPPIDMQQLSLVVQDTDRGRQSDWSHVDAAQTHLSGLPTVILAWEYQSAGNVYQTQTNVIAAQNSVTYLSKPFDARILYSTIEGLLLTSVASKAALEAEAEATLLATYSAHAAPSIWPIVTAAGLLLAVIGLLFQVAITAAGFLIVVIALLLWTIGTQPKQGKIAHVAR